MLILLALLACEGDEPPERDPTDQGIQDYRELKNLLDTHLVEIATGTSTSLDPYGWEGRLHVLDRSSGPVNLSSLDVATDVWTECGAIVGSVVVNFEGSSTHIAHSEQSNGDVHFYEIEPDCAEVALIDLPQAPGLGRWPYAVEGSEFYWIDEEPLELIKWDGSMTSLGVLDDLGLTSVAWFRKRGNHLAISDGSDVHHLDLQGGSEFTGHASQFDGSLSMGDSGFVFRDRDAINWYSYSEGLRDLTNELNFASYAVNTVYQTAHHPHSDGYAVLLNDWVVYRGVDGIFAYDLVTGTIEPLALNEYDTNQKYTQVEVAGGAVFVLSYFDFDTTLYRIDNPVLQTSRR